MTGQVAPILCTDVGSMRLTMLGRFSFVHDGLEAQLGSGSQRLLAFVALQHSAVRRVWVSGQLWSETDDAHASWSLRAALHRLPRPQGHSVVHVGGNNVGLCPAVEVDLGHADHWARSVLGGSPEPPGSELAGLQLDVLPEWDDDWVILERERHRQLRLHALESLSGQLIDQGHYGLAVDAAMSAVQADPLRESAQRALIRVHIAHGNMAEAVRQYRRCRTSFIEEMGLEPSRRLTDLVFGGG
jgi:DNA-binding SARP family transcriptional activator